MAYQYNGKDTLELRLAETEQQLAEALRTIRELKKPKRPTPHSEGYLRLLAATKEATDYDRRKRAQRAQKVAA